MHSNLDKYVAIARINFLNSLVYVTDMLGSAIFIALIIFLLGSLWTAVFAGQKTVQGFTLIQMLWYVVMTEAIIVSQGRVIEKITEEIQTGVIGNALNKPYQYLWYRYASVIGQAVVKFFLVFASGGIVAALMVGVDWSILARLPLVVVPVFCAISLHFAMMAFLGLFGFWWENGTALHFIYQKFLFTIGGMLVPLEIFPAWLAGVSSMLPFSYVAYHPARLFVHFSYEGVLRVVATQIIWIAIMIIACAAVYHIGIRRVSVNGG
ncbi:MAG: ABC transporter permease [Nanoarchaeota archaeon]